MNGWSRDLGSLAEAPGVIALAVTDTGIGVAEPEQKRIFEAFAQGDGTTARKAGGTGLGLSISRELAGLLGGELKLTGGSEDGSTFVLYLPLGQVVGTAPVGPVPATPPMEAIEPPAPAPSTPARPEQPPERAPTEALADTSFHGAKVLVVDDDYRNVFALTALLERADAEVTGVESGADAIAALEAGNGIELVLMDIMMPVMDGYETIREIRARGPLESLPIIAVTGKVVPGERERCLAAGANDYVPKPVDSAELIAAIGPWLPTRAEPAGSA